MISPYFDLIKANVDRCGLHIMGVGGTEDCPPFTYTIGFAAHGLPEVIAFALDYKVVGQYLNRYFDEIVVQKTRDAGPAVLMPEDDWFNMPFSVINADQAKAEEWGCQAFYFAEDMGWKKPEFVQWVWPDPAGNLPWQAEWNASFNRHQPLLTKVV